MSGGASAPLWTLWECSRAGGSLWEGGTRERRWHRPCSLSHPTTRMDLGVWDQDTPPCEEPSSPSVWTHLPLLAGWGRSGDVSPKLSPEGGDGRGDTSPAVSALV